MSLKILFLICWNFLHFVGLKIHCTGNPGHGSRFVENTAAEKYVSNTRIASPYIIVLYILFLLWVYLYKKVKFATIVEGDQKALFSIATTLRCREGH